MRILREAQSVRPSGGGDSPARPQTPLLSRPNLGFVWFLVADPPPIGAALAAARHHDLKELSMNHRRRVTLVALALVAGSAVAVASTAASGGVKTLDLTGTVTGFHLALDAKPAGQSAGDIGYELGTVSAHGKRIGRFQGVCTQLPQASSQCAFTLGLPDGQILIQAAYGPGFNTGAVAREAIVGGTGAYAGIRGQGRDRELSNVKLAFHLELIQ